MPRLHVRGPYPYTDLRVLTLSLREVASGVGRISADVPPGIYRVTAQVPGASTERLVTVSEAGETEVTDLSLDLESITQVYGARTRPEWRDDLIRAASRTVDVRVPDNSHPGELLIVVRAVEGKESALPDVRVQTAQGAQLARLDRPGKYSRLSDGLITLSIQLPAGTYELTHEVDGQGRRGQAVYVASGWQTQVFAPWNKDEAGLSRALVAMARIGCGFDPDRGNYESVNAALDGLARGRVVLTGYEEDGLLNAKSTDPMLGLIGAYGYILRGKVTRERLDVIIQNLLRLLPHSPDVQLLARVAKKDYGVTIEADLSGGISAPPMFSLGAQWLIERATEDDRLIAATSWPSRIALTRTSDSVWTRWDVAARSDRRARAIVREYLRIGSDIAGELQMTKLAQKTEVPLSVIKHSVRSERLYAFLIRLRRGITRTLRIARPIRR